MILAFDIGNTNIKTALFKDGKLIQVWRISTDTKRTGDEYFSLLRPLFRDADISTSDIEKTVISSVVPALIGITIPSTILATEGSDTFQLVSFAKEKYSLMLKSVSVNFIS